MGRHETEAFRQAETMVNILLDEVIHAPTYHRAIQACDAIFHVRLTMKQMEREEVNIIAANGGVTYPSTWADVARDEGGSVAESEEESPDAL